MKFDKETSIPLEDFFEAYYQCRKRKRNTINALLFEVDYEANLVKLWKDVNSRNYKIGKSICFLVTRPKLREVFAADFRDRVVHHVIMMRLEPLFERVFIEDNYNCRKGKGNLFGVNRLRDKIRECSNNYTEDCYIGKFDLRGFFMSIHKPTLLEMLRNFINRKYEGNDKDLLLWLVEEVVMNCPQYNCVKKTPDYMWGKLPKNKSLFTCGDNRGLPIGNLTSQCFANFYMHQFDNILLDKFRYYGRYVDDFYILSKRKEDIVSQVNNIKTYLADNLSVSLHPDKTYIQYYKKGVKFTGSIIKQDRIYISNSSISNIYKVIHRFNSGEINAETAKQFIQSLNSYWGFLKHCCSYNLKRRLSGLFLCEWYRFINYNSKRKAFGIWDIYKENRIINQDAKNRKNFCEKYYPL